MRRGAQPDLPAVARRKALRRDLACASLNAAVWAVGNGLVSSTLATYLALELGARGLGVSLILAAPHLAGVLRLASPGLVRRLGGRRPVCLACFVSSGLVLLAMPLVVAPRPWGLGWGVAALVGFWSLYHLLEYVGVVALWSWLGDVYPLRLRGALLGHRERWLLVGRVTGIGVSFLVVSGYSAWRPEGARWEGLAASASLGAVCLALAAAPLVALAPRPQAASEAPRAPLRAALAACRDPRYGPLMAWSAALSLANGLTGAAQSVYPARVLGIGYEPVLALRSAMHAGQGLAAPWVGRGLDRLGARRLMALSAAVVATGPLFYLAAGPGAPWWIAGAYAVWVAYVGLNVGLDWLKLNLAPPENNAPAIAAFYVASDLATAASMIVGGWTLDWLGAGGTDSTQRFGWLFLAGFAARAAMAVWALWLPGGRPGAPLEGPPAASS